MPSPVKLQFAAPKRGMPPAHFADMDREQIVSALGDLGLPKFRADQLARQYLSLIHI